MKYLLYNPLAKGGKMNDFIIKVVQKYDKKNIKVTPVSVLDDDKVKSVIETLSDFDEIEIAGGDGTLHKLLNEIDFGKIKSKIYFRKAGTGNDFARGHKGKVFEISKEIENTPYFLINDKKYKFINGVGMGIDAYVCDSVNKNQKKESYYKTALRVFKEFKPFTIELDIDGKKEKFDNVFFFVCMNGKYIGGGMKIAPKALRDDEWLDLYVITSKNYKQLIRMMPLVLFGWHGILKKHVTYCRCKNVVATTFGCDMLQTDGEVIENVKKIEIHR